MTTKLLSVILLISLTAYGQTSKYDCKEILNKVPHFVRHSANEPCDSVQIDFDILKSCGELDSIDSELLSGPILASIMIQQTAIDKVTTYHTILNSISAFKKTDNYAKFREATIAAKTIENKIVTIEEFEKDKEFLTKAGISQSELDTFKLFIQSNASQRMTYKEAFVKYSSSNKSAQTSPKGKIEFNKLIDLESAIKTGKENGKRVLLYFSCHHCVNARRVEDLILTDQQVKTLLADKFSYFVAYTDDRTEDKATKSTMGRKFIELQSEKFKTAYQPYFCIIDNNGKVLSEIGFTSKAEEFIEFLNKGLK